MSEQQQDDLETKIEDAIKAMMEASASPEIRGVYAWAEPVLMEPAIIVTATRTGTESASADGDIYSVDVVIALRHAKTGFPRNLFRCVEEGIGWTDATHEGPSLADRIARAAGGSLTVFPPVSVGAGSKSFEDENKIRREITLTLKVTHGKL